MYGCLGGSNRDKAGLARQSRKIKSISGCFVGTQFLFAIFSLWTSYCVCYVLAAAIHRNTQMKWEREMNKQQSCNIEIFHRFTPAFQCPPKHFSSLKLKFSHLKIKKIKFDFIAKYKILKKWWYCSMTIPCWKPAVS